MITGGIHGPNVFPVSHSWTSVLLFSVSYMPLLKQGP